MSLPVDDCTKGLFPRWAQKIGELDGWSRIILGITVGIIAAAALPPVYALPLLCISFPCLIWLIDGTENWRSAFKVGWSFGLGYFTAGLYWIAYSLIIDPKFIWLVPFAVLGIPSILAIYIGFVAVLARIASRGFTRVVVLTVSWALMEWLRGQLFTGFPWNSLGSIWVISDVALQMAAYVGVLGLSLLTVFISASLAMLAYSLSSFNRYWFVPSMACLLTIFLPGLFRPGFDDPLKYYPDIRLRIVQPNIAQKVKWRRDLKDKHLATYLSLSKLPAVYPITHLVWPETAAPFEVSRDVFRRKQIATVVPQHGFLLTGSIRTNDAGSGPLEIWNSFHVLSSSGTIEKTHDKFHLVPFGEYIPLGKILRNYLKLKKITKGRIDFSSGVGPQTLQVPTLPAFSLLICYEVIFGDNVVSSNDRPKWLLNITNDAWFGPSSGPYQHFAMARLRAVEQGLPLIRAANTGVSGVIDAYGRVIKKLPLNTQGIIDSTLPKPTVMPTFFSKAGDWPILFLSMLILMALILRDRRTRIPFSPLD